MSRITTIAERARRLVRLDELMAGGVYSSVKLAELLVAEGLPVSDRQTRDDIKKVLAQWQEEFADKRSEWKWRKVREAVARNAALKARIVELEAEWERSKSNKERSRQKETKGAGDDGTRTEVEAATEGRLGDPAYLAEIRQIEIEVRRNDEFIAELMGLYDPRKHEVTNPELDALIAGELARVAGTRQGADALPAPADADGG